MTDETSPGTVREARGKARVALLNVITEAVAEVRSNTFTLSQQASTISALAEAYRLVEGGPLPSRDSN